MLSFGTWQILMWKRRLQGWRLVFHDFKRFSQVNIYLFKVNNKSTRKRCEISWKLTLKLFHTFLWCFYCLLWTTKYLLGYCLEYQILADSSDMQSPGRYFMNENSRIMFFYFLGRKAAIISPNSPKSIFVKNNDVR